MRSPMVLHSALHPQHMFLSSNRTRSLLTDEESCLAKSPFWGQDTQVSSPKPELATVWVSPESAASHRGHQGCGTVPSPRRCRGGDKFEALPVDLSLTLML